MNEQIKPLPPITVKINLWNKSKLLFMILISFILWITLIFTGLSLLAYYIYCITTKGIFSEESIKYAVILVVGAYFCLILDKNKIYEALNVKKDLPFITIEQVKEREK